MPTETGRALSARISRIHPALRQGTLATVEIDMDSRPFGLPTGATLDVDLVTDIHEGWHVPVGAVLENTEAAYVFCVVSDGTIHVERVSLLSSGPDWDIVSVAQNHGGITDSGKQKNLRRGLSATAAFSHFRHPAGRSLGLHRF